MITEKDLQEAITECLGQRNPNTSTCIKLAAFYTIRREMFGGSDRDTVSFPSYSNISSPECIETYVDYDGDTEFAHAIKGMDAHRAWIIVDELVDAVRIVNPRLYRGMMKKIEEG